MSKCCWKNGADRRAQRRVATSLQFANKVMSVKYKKVKHNKTRCAHTRHKTEMKLVYFSTPPRATCKKNQMSQPLSLSSQRHKKNSPQEAVITRQASESQSKYQCAGDQKTLGVPRCCREESHITQKNWTCRQSHSQFTPGETVAHVQRVQECSQQCCP